MHKQRQALMNSNLQDLNPLLAGVSEATVHNSKPLQSYAYTLIHYITQGHGTFFINGQAYPVRTGQAFLILPGQDASFESSTTDPWALRWVGFGGDLSHNFVQLPPVFDVPKAVWDNFFDLSDMDTSDAVLSYLLASELMLLYAKLLDPKNAKQDYVQKVVNYVQRHHTEKLSVEQIAASLGLTRSYLTDIFRRQMGKTIRAYIIEIRIMTAKQYMQSGASVKEAALQCGFNDVSYFIKRFTKETGMTPTAWKQKVQADKEAYRSE